MAAGAARDREVEHLGGKDKRGNQAGHRRRTVVQPAPGPAQAHGNAGRGQDAGPSGHRGVDEAVGDVHGPPSSARAGHTANGVVC
jgi:hypothetical protein